MADGVTAAIANLVSVGWSFDPTTPPEVARPHSIGGASDALVAWLASFSELSSPDDAVWFLGRGDYVAPVREGFAWNAFEMISREAADTDQEAADVDAFWSTHCPILLSVRDRYSFLAVRADGAISHGEEPEFEETTVVASDFEALLDALSLRAMNRHHLVERLIFGLERAS